MAEIERLGRVDDPRFGKCVRAAFSTWEGPVTSSETGRRIRHSGLFPVDQRGHACHRRHPTGYDEATGVRMATVSPSCSFYVDLCRYGQFTWG